MKDKEYIRFPQSVRKVEITSAEGHVDSSWLEEAIVTVIAEKFLGAGAPKKELFQFVVDAAKGEGMTVERERVQEMLDELVSSGKLETYFSEDISVDGKRQYRQVQYRLLREGDTEVKHLFGREATMEPVPNATITDVLACIHPRQHAEAAAIIAQAIKRFPDVSEQDLYERCVQELRVVQGAGEPGRDFVDDATRNHGPFVSVEVLRNLFVRGAGTTFEQAYNKDTEDLPQHEQFEDHH